MNLKYILFMFFIFTLACKSRINPGVKQTVEEWIGKSITFPEHVEREYPVKNDTINTVENDDESVKEYKILLYSDSTGCTSCKLHLPVWKTYIAALRAKADFIFYFHPKAEQNLLHLLNVEDFAHPVYIDKNDELNKLNHFPDNPMFHCFLLDGNNEVLAIGNPVDNSGIWELYKRIITKN